MWYHFAFMAISLAMFGLAAGAILVEVLKKRDAGVTLANTGFAFALTSVVCFIVQLYIPADPENELVWTALAFTLIAIPFVFGGMVVCVALTRFPDHTASLYAADLAGSAVGCILTIPILNHIHAPTAVILNAGIAALAAAAFAWPLHGKMRWIASVCCLALFVRLRSINPQSLWISNGSKVVRTGTTVFMKNGMRSHAFTCVTPARNHLDGV
jgi:hypothetical protein